MNKLFRNYLFLLIPVLTLLVVSCKDDEDPVAAPQITSVSPNQGLPGSTVTITGTNLANATSVTIGGETATHSANTNTSITAIVPATASPGPTQIRVTTAGGSDTADFTVLEDDPGGGNEATITGIDPTSGGPGTEVTITGTNFTGATAVAIGGTNVENYTVSDAGDNITFTIPEDATEGYTGTISVTTAAGTVTSAEDMTFTFTPAGTGEPNITGVSPNTGGPGTRMTITGTNFNGITGLRIGETDIASEDLAIDEAGENITITIPDDAVEGDYTGTFTITTAEGEEIAGSEDITFTYNPDAPGITAVDPENLTGEAGDVVIITGRNLAAAEVFFTGADGAEVQAEVDVTSSTDELTFTIPEGAVTGPVYVRTPLGETYIGQFTINGGDNQAINVNGGFEDAEVGAITEGSVPGWSFSGNDGELATFEIVDDQVQEGARALAVNILQLGENPWDIEARQENVTVEPNTTYTYSIWARGPEGSSADFTVGRPDFSEFQGARTTAEMTGDWQEITLQFTTGAEDTEIRTPIHFSLEGNVGQTIYIDNLQVMPVQ